MVLKIFFQLFKTLDPDPHRWLDEPVLGIGCGNTSIWIFYCFWSEFRTNKNMLLSKITLK